MKDKVGVGGGVIVGVALVVTDCESDCEELVLTVCDAERL